MGWRRPRCTVEVHLANGLPSFTLVGLADTEVKESRERVRAALQQSGFAFPHNKRITVNLAPADLPKESGRFDLPIALGILAAGGQLDAARLAGCEFAGELSLAGELRPVRGALALALALRAQAGAGRALVLPAGQRRARRRWCRGLRRARAPTTCCRWCASLLPGDARARRCRAARPLPRRRRPRPAPDLRDVKGQAGAKRALEIAAAGGHSLLLVGPPGTGKSMLAQRLPGLLPPMDEDEALASAALLGLARAGGRRPARFGRRPGARAAPLGQRGGAGRRRLAAAAGRDLARARRRAVPRRAARVPARRRWRRCASRWRAAASRSRARRGRRAFPARFQLVAAMNPCPCGCLGAPPAPGAPAAARPTRWRATRAGCRARCSTASTCRSKCRPRRRPSCWRQPDGEPSAAVAARVAAARERAAARARARQRGAGRRARSTRSPAPTRPAPRFLRSAAERLGWSGRGLHRALKVARTIADLAGAEAVGAAHVAEALQFRRGLEALRG